MSASEAIFIKLSVLTSYLLSLFGKIALSMDAEDEEARGAGNSNLYHIDPD